MALMRWRIGSVSLDFPGLRFASIPSVDDPQFAWMTNGNILGSLLGPRAVVGMLAVAHQVGHRILNRLRQTDFGATIVDLHVAGPKIAPIQPGHMGDRNSPLDSICTR
eukprot:COSAG02_NODE_29532_length_567_cov_1.335470_2_plen_107_part_01